MRWKQIALVVIVAALIALAGCSGTTAEPDNTNQSKATDVDGAEHVIVTDNSAEVVCYVYEHAGYAGGSVDCMPKDAQNATAMPVDSVQESQVSESPTLIRTVYPDETNVCYTYQHAGYAGGDTACLDFSETTFVAQD